MTLAFFCCAAITAISAVVSLGFSIAAAVEGSGHVRTVALYTNARSFALLLVSLVPFQSGSVAWLEAVASAMIVAQACDAVVGLTIRSWVKTLGPAGIAVLNVGALFWVAA